MATNVCVVKTLLTAKRKSNGNFFVAHLNSWFAGTHENHENWHTTYKNEFTGFILYIIIVSTVPTFFFAMLVQK